MESNIDLKNINGIPDNFIIRFNNLKKNGYKNGNMYFEIDQIQKDFLEQLKTLTNSKNNFETLSMKCINFKPRNEYFSIIFKIDKPKYKLIQFTFKNIIDLDQNLKELL